LYQERPAAVPPIAYGYPRMFGNNEMDGFCDDTNIIFLRHFGLQALLADLR
jgi:hypothetical protein